MTRIQENVYTIPEEIFKDEVFRKLVHTKTFSRLRSLGPECLSETEKKQIATQIAEYCKLPEKPKEEELKEYSRVFLKRTIEVFNHETSSPLIDPVYWGFLLLILAQTMKI